MVFIAGYEFLSWIFTVELGISSACMWITFDEMTR